MRHFMMPRGFQLHNGTGTITESTLITSPCSFTTDTGVQYTSSFLTRESADLNAIGVKEVLYEVHNEKHHHVESTYYEENTTHFLVKKNLLEVHDSLADIKTFVKNEIKVLCFGLLVPTDWLISRYTEKGTAIPGSATTERDLARSTTTTEKAAVDALSTYDAVAAYDYRANFVSAVGEQMVLNAENTAKIIKHSY